MRPSGPDPLKRWTQSRKVWRSIPPIFAAAPRSIPSLTAASDRSRRLWLTFFDRRANAQPNNPLAISPLKPWRDPPRQLESAPSRFGNPPMSQPAEPLVLLAFISRGTRLKRQGRLGGRP